MAFVFSETDFSLLANANLQGEQSRPSMVALSEDRFLVIWADDQEPDVPGAVVRGQIFDLEGTRIGGAFDVGDAQLGSGYEIPPSLAGDELRPDVAVAADGRFFVSWRSALGEGFQFYGQAFAADGTPTGERILIHEGPMDYRQQISSVWNEQGVSLLWDDGQAIQAWQHSMADGAVGRQFVVDDDLGGDPTGDSMLVALGNGTVLAVYQTTDGSVLGRFLGSDDEEPMVLVPTSGNRLDLYALSLPGGGFAVLTTELDYRVRLIMRSYDDDGRPHFNKTLFDGHVDLDGGHRHLSAHAAEDGNVVVVWENGAQVFDAAGDPVSGTFSDFFSPTVGERLRPHLETVLIGNTLYFASEQLSANTTDLVDVFVKSVELVQDNEPPAAPVVTRYVTADGDGIINYHEALNQLGYVVEGTVEPGVTLFYDDGNMEQVPLDRYPTIAVAEDGSWEWQSERSSEDIEIWARDSAGQISPRVEIRVPRDINPPLWPELDQIVGGDGVITAAELAEGVTISGLAEVGATVELTLGDWVWTTRADSETGRWSVVLDGDQIDTDYQGTLYAHAIDAVGNSSDLIMFDWDEWLMTGGPDFQSVQVALSPSAPIMDSPLIQNAAMLEVGLTFEGSGDPGSLVEMRFNGYEQTLTVGQDGRWQVTIPPDQLPADGEYEVSLQGTDGANNDSIIIRHDILLDRVAPEVPSLDLILSAGSPHDEDSFWWVIKNEDLQQDITLLGSAEEGSQVSMLFGDQLFEFEAEEHSHNHETYGWAYTLSEQDLPEPGPFQVFFQALDLAGNISDIRMARYGSDSDYALMAEIGTNQDDVLRGRDLVITYQEGLDGNDRLLGSRFTRDGVATSGDDTLDGGFGNDTLNGGDGDDLIIGGPETGDLADVVYAGDGNDTVLAADGNDLAYGGDGNDRLDGNYGADTLIGQDGNDSLSGGAWGDVLFGGAGDDFLNGGFGFDRLNGGEGADRFFHLGVGDHGADWIQDYAAPDGDVLVTGRLSTLSQYQVNFAETQSAGQAGVAEAFVIYRPTDQILWALVDGAAQDEINIVINGVAYDLMA